MSTYVAASRQRFVELLKELCARFESSARDMREQGYDEATLRLEYLDPLFAALGWNVWNRPPQPLHLRDVIVENRTDVKGRTGRVDYLFRTSGLNRWLCEAKKPFDNINRHAFQVQNYTYNMRLWVGVLADFEHFIVYVVGGRPNREHPFSPVPGWRLHYTDYETKAGKIWDLFSREAVEAGALEQFVQSLSKIRTRGRQGWLIKPDRTKQVDEVFLSFLEQQRVVFAKDLVRRNPKVKWTAELLADCLQAIFDRLLFQRVSEDRGIDVGTPLERTLQHWDSRGRVVGQLWPAIVGNFRHLAGAFNGGVYGKDPKQPHFADKLLISDVLLEDFIEEIAGDSSEWLFGTMPLSVIGSVYERFLGSAVDAKGNVNPKLEARKAGGVYYTPEPVVKELVDKTVGPLLNEKRPDEVLKLKIIDPACGSGSFLLLVYDRMLQHCLDWFDHHRSEAKPADVFEQGGKLWLTTSFKRRLLRSCIYGVDLDNVAVQVARMSLCLKVLEDETQEALAKEKSLFPKETFLPDLDENVIHANSLIPVTAYPDLIDEDYLAQCNAVDWAALIAKTPRRRGFDAVVGNPPWGADLDATAARVARHAHQAVIVRMPDTYIYFTHLSMETLLRQGGLLGLVLPGTLLNQSDAAQLRRYLLDNGLDAVANLGQGIFGDALNTTCLIVANKQGVRSTHMLINDITTVPPELRETAIPKWDTVERAAWEAIVRDDPDTTFYTKDLVRAAAMLVARNTLGTLADAIDDLGIQRGVTPDVLEAHLLTEGEAEREGIEDEVLRPTIRGEDIKPFHRVRPTMRLIYTTAETNPKAIPNTIAHMRHFKSRITCSEVRDKKHPWWRLHRPRGAEVFDRAKVIGVTTSRRIELVYDESGELVVTDAMYVFGVRTGIPVEFVLGIMQSTAFLEFYRIGNQGDGRVIPQVKATKLMEVPFPRWDPTDEVHKAIVSTVKALMALSASEAAGVTRNLAAQRRKLDRLAEKAYSGEQMESEHELEKVDAGEESDSAAQ
jgi:hypothetical protein